MITIKQLTVKNFMSVGNQTQAVDFGKENLTLVLGENLDQGGDDSGSRNGTGKTTIVDKAIIELGISPEQVRFALPTHKAKQVIMRATQNYNR